MTRAGTTCSSLLRLGRAFGLAFAGQPLYRPQCHDRMKSFHRREQSKVSTENAWFRDLSCQVLSSSSQDTTPPSTILLCLHSSVYSTHQPPLGIPDFTVPKCQLSVISAPLTHHMSIEPLWRGHSIPIGLFSAFLTTTDRAETYVKRMQLLLYIHANFHDSADMSDSSTMSPEQPRKENMRAITARVAVSEGCLLRQTAGADGHSLGGAETATCRDATENANVCSGSSA